MEGGWGTVGKTHGEGFCRCSQSSVGKKPHGLRNHYSSPILEGYTPSIEEHSVGTYCLQRQVQDKCLTPPQQYSIPGMKGKAGCTQYCNRKGCWAQAAGEGPGREEPVRHGQGSQAH